MLIRELPGLIFGMNLNSAMCTQRKNAGSASPDFTAANSYNFHGCITDAYDIGCEMQKKRIECAIMIKAALAEEE